MKTNTVIEYKGLQADDKAFINKVKEAWTEQGNKIKDLKSLSMYIKPEESKVYYVINDSINGSIPLFDN